MKKIVVSLIILIILGIGISFSINIPNDKQDNVNKNKTLKGQVIYVDDNQITLQDVNNIIYTIGNNFVVNVGDKLEITYDKELNKNKEVQNIEIINYQVLEEDINYKDWQDKGIFNEYYIKAYQTLESLSLDEKLSQLLLVRVPKENASEILEQYSFGGYLFFERDFKNKTKNEVIDMIRSFQNVSKVPLLTAIDEEGGKVSRISSNKNLVSEPFKSPQELYKLGGFDLIKTDTINKSKILRELGLNLNLAPVVDVATDETSYIYPRTLGENYLLTGTYAKTVIDASKGTGVSYTLKHFPGYGNNSDTHLDTSIDERDYLEFMQEDLLPFKEGINAGGEAVMISHNVINTLDENNPASLSPSVHNLLRNELGFTGIIITEESQQMSISFFPIISLFILKLIDGIIFPKSLKMSCQISLIYDITIRIWIMNTKTTYNLIIHFHCINKILQPSICCRHSILCNKHYIITSAF